MAVTPSTMLDLGTSAPEFSLPDVTTGKTITLEDFTDAKALLVIFLCAHCPYVIHVREEFARIGKDFKDAGLGIVSICSNDVENYPDDSPENLRAMAADCGFNFPVCYDETQDVAKAYTAACTPDIFLFDAARRLVYRGQLDETRPNRGRPHGSDLRAAINAVLADRPVSPVQKPSTGCNIKWKPGNQPNY
jgi:peroxiredoxin